MAAAGLLPVTMDFVFKLIFGDRRNVDILGDFLKSVLDIPADEYESVTVLDPDGEYEGLAVLDSFLKKEHEGDKSGILDVKVQTKRGHIVNVEIQVRRIPEMKHRSVYFISKMVTEQMAAGRSHADIKRSVSIIITCETIVPENAHYHNQFRYRSHRDGAEFTDLTEINTLELSKLPDDEDGLELWRWMKFIESGDEGVLNMLAEKNPKIQKAVGVLKELSADERARMLHERREIARRDMVSLMDGAKREGRIEGRVEGRAEGRNERTLELARNFLRLNVPLRQIAEGAGLSQEEVEALR